MCQEHWHFGAVLACVENLFDFMSLRIEFDFRTSKEFALARFHVVAISARRRRKARKRVESFGVIGTSTKTACCADARKINVADKRSIKGEYLHHRRCVFQVRRNQLMIHDAQTVERLQRRRNDLA